VALRYRLNLVASASNYQQYESEQLLGPAQDTDHAIICCRSGVLSQYTACTLGPGWPDRGHGDCLSRLESEEVGALYAKVVAAPTCHLGIWSCQTMAE
jgi:hypothetical protein